MAPYEGDVAAVNVNELEFVKFAEGAADTNGVWGTVKLMDNTNSTWTATIPADIKPGKYIIRHEVGNSPGLLRRHGLEMPRTEPVPQIIALHFTLSTTPNVAFTPIGPQCYITCFNFNVTGSGTATPKGAKFPGTYDMADPALNWDLNSPPPTPWPGRRSIPAPTPPTWSPASSSPSARRWTLKVTRSNTTRSNTTRSTRR